MLLHLQLMSRIRFGQSEAVAVALAQAMQDARLAWPTMPPRARTHPPPNELILCIIGCARSLVRLDSAVVTVTRRGPQKLAFIIYSKTWFS